MRRSQFRSGSREIIHSIDGSDMELIGVRSVVKGDSAILGAIATRLVSVSQNPSLMWLPGVQERYSTQRSAELALDRISKRKNAIGWILQRTGDHSERNKCDPDAVEGIVTLHEGIHVAVGTEVDRQHRYVLASFWTAADVSFPDQIQVAHTMFYTLPKQVCRDPHHLIASLDGPTSEDATLPLDPSAGFAYVGDVWENARTIDDPCSVSEGIVTNSTTRLYHQTIANTAPVAVDVVEWEGHDVSQTIRTELCEPTGD